MTPSRQETDRPTSSSSSSTSPTTVTSIDSETREREDRNESDTSPVPVSSFNVDDATWKTVVCRESNRIPGYASTSPTTTVSSDSETRAREDMSG